MIRLLALLLALLPLPALTQPTCTPIVIGQSYKLDSATMGTERTINVWLPPGYEKGTQRYPVLYLLDGGINQDFHHISGLAQLGTIVGTTRDVIVVGIETMDRRNELAFPVATDAKLKSNYPTAGQSERFRRYIANEVKPWVEKSYRTSGENALIGESLAGLFVVETMLRVPGLFDTHIAISPSLWWDNEALVKVAPSLLPKARGRLWLTVANEQGMGVAPFAKILKDVAPAALHWTYAPRPDETHATIYHAAAPRPDETHATIYHAAALAAIRQLYPQPSQ